MHIFIDESGIHKRAGYSAFALVYVAVVDVEDFEYRVNAIEKSIGIRGFHWSEANWKTREKFFEGIMRLSWTAKVGIITNPILPDVELENILQHLLVEKKIASISIDGKKPKKYERKIKKVLRDKGVSTKKLRTVRDESCAGVRVADAIAGLFRAHFDGKENAGVEKWYIKLRKKKHILVLQ